MAWALASRWGTARPAPQHGHGSSLLSPAHTLCHFGPRMFSGVCNFCCRHHKPPSHALPNRIVPCRVSVSGFLTFLSFSGFGRACCLRTGTRVLPRGCSPDPERKRGKSWGSGSLGDEGCRL